MTIPTIPPYTGEPALRSNPETFPANAEYAMQKIATLPDDINPAIDGINEVIGQTNADAISAASGAASALASAASASDSADRAEQATVDLIYSTGFIPLGDFAAGVVVPSVQHALWYQGELYAPSNTTLPHTTTAATPLTDSADWRNVTLEAAKTVARSLNCSDSQVIYASDTATVLDDVEYIYDAVAQKTWIKPAGVGLGETVVSVVGDTLTTSASVYTLKPVPTKRGIVNALDYGVVRYNYDDPAFLSGPIDSLSALKKACDDTTGLVLLPAGLYAIYGDGIDLNNHACAGIVGEGYDHWETIYQNANNLKSDAKGTHIYLVGVGNKIHSIDNIGKSSIGSVTSGALTFELTDFTLSDSVDQNPATPRPFSCGVKYGRNHTVSDLRILPYHNGINGYNDELSTTLSDNWDVCLWGASAVQSKVDVQAVGHARLAAHLLTENSGYGEYGNCERMEIKTYAQGQRGLVIRATEQIPVISFTANSFTIPHTPDMTITRSDRIRAIGTTTNAFFTVVSSSYAAGQVTINVAELVDGSPFGLRSGYTGVGWAKTSIRDSLFEPLQHISGNKSTSFGLPTSFAREVSGFPMRGLTFDNSKSQATVDDGNTYWGDCQDIRNIVGQYEGGHKVAIDNNDPRFTNSTGFTSNLRELDTITSSSTEEIEFTPRDCFDTYRQFPTQFTDGETVIKPWRDSLVQLKDANGFVRMQYGSDGVDIALKTGQNVSILNSTGQSLLSIFGASRNATFGSNLTSGAELVSTTNTRPLTSGGGSCGTAVYPFSEVFALATAINPSTRDIKQDIEPFPEALLDAWELHVKWCQYRVKQSVIEKGEDARIHGGVIFEDIQAAFEQAGIDPFSYGVLCVDTWVDQYEEIPAVVEQNKRIEIDDDGIEHEIESIVEIEPAKKILTKKAGTQKAVRYTEAQAIENAMVRRKIGL